MINDYEATNPITTDATYTGTGAQSESISNDDVISVINGLIETNKDGQEGFKTAADGVERSDLKSLFYEFSQQRSQFAGELQGLVRDLGGDPENSGSFSGAIHRGWMNIKAAVTGQDEQAILNECERGEDSAKGAYRSALENNLPANVRETIQNQNSSIQAAHDRIKALRDSADNETATSATSGF
jgi:uncharacterized protein (TIGR02284 family)